MTKNWMRTLLVRSAFGYWHHKSGAHAVEREKRREAAQRGWHLIGHAWHKFGYSIARLFFLAFVGEAAHTGIAGIVWSQQDAKVIDTVLVRYLRVLLRGKAFKEEGWRYSLFTFWCCSVQRSRA